LDFIQLPGTGEFSSNIVNTLVFPFQVSNDLEENIIKYRPTTINGVLKRHYYRQMNKAVQLRFHNVISETSLVYGSECWTLRFRDKQRIEAPQMRFFMWIERSNFERQTAK
jgi:hypothetical protein